MKSFGFAVVTIAIIAYATSWAVTAGIIKIITMLVGVNFSFKIVTAIWLVMILIKSLFHHNNSSK